MREGYSPCLNYLTVILRAPASRFLPFAAEGHAAQTKTSLWLSILPHAKQLACFTGAEMKKTIRNNFANTVILAGGYDQEKAEADLEKGLGDLVAFGRPHISNPDLADRFKNNHPLSADLKMDLFYTADEKGYTDYPFYNS